MTDYHNFCTIDTPKEQRDKWNVGDIWINSIKCLLCNETIRSRNRHDSRQCSCKNAFIDGGSCYPRYGAESLDTVEIITIPFSDV